MKTITLSDLTQDDFDAAAETVAAGVKAYNRKLDTRDGTVLRDLLVNPDAAMQGVLAGQIEEARKSSSLKRLQEAQEAGETIDQDDVNAILSNFNITPSSGTAAKGVVKVVVSDGTVSYSIAAGAIFKTSEEAEFTVDEQVIASATAVDSTGTSRTTELYSGAAGYFFLVPVTASDVGSAGNIAQGTSLEPESRVPSFVMAEAYKDFCGGADTQDISEIIQSIPTGLAIRGFVHKTATEGMLRSVFDSGEHPIVAVSTVGYGNAAQLRDKHNLFGVGVGGRVDVYVRNFTDAYTLTATLTGKLVSAEDGTYSIDVPVGTFPGSCWVKSISDPFSNASEDEESVLDSLAFSAVRTADITAAEHDFDSANAAVEAFNTVWQGFSITLNEVPANSEGVWEDDRPFKVTVYCMPQASDLQTYVDRDDIRNVATDVIVRCPIVCTVSVNAVVNYDPKNPIDETTAKTQIRTYINNLGFVGRLTRSEIVQILKNLGAASVEMPNDDMLTGELHDAEGTLHTLSGDALDIASIADGQVMLTKDTVVFCAEEKNIQIKLTPKA